MSSDARGGITRSGSSGSYTYAVKTGCENMPVVFVSWYDSIRFAKWLQNGQDGGSTETGTYTITGSTPYWTVAIPDAATRASWDGAHRHWVLPAENEWYKAAYYQPAAQDGDTDSYWLYPTRTNNTPYSDQPPGSGAPVQANTANFDKNDSVANGYDDGYAVTGSTTYVATTNYLTNVGAYTQSASFYGTFDQGGNVWEWNEADIYGDGSSRGLRGGSWDYNSYDLASSYRAVGGGIPDPSSGDYDVGFRVALVPEPGSITLVVCGIIAVLIWRRRRS